MTYQDILDLINANLASGSKIQAVKHREVETALLDFVQSNVAQQYDIKAIYANPTYLGDNFDSNGLGKNLRTGWAICNGKNSTPNIGGRVIVSYGGAFTTLNATGGEKEHTLTEAEMPSHTHDIDLVDESGSGAPAGGNPAGVSNGTGKTKSQGGGVPFSIMQPYIVLVYIMKL